ncbi:MAG: hypothetical protein ABI601_01080 [bacterium]
MGQPRRLALVALFALLSHAPVAGAQISVVGSTVVEHDATAGERYESSILVRNTSDKPRAVRVYKSDYAFFADGTSRFDAPGELPRSNSAWVDPAVSTLTIPAGSDVAVTYTVRVPAADTLRGTYWSALMIEGEVTPPVVNGARQIGLGAVIRYAVQVATHLQATGSRTVALSNQRLVTDSSGTRALEVDVRNSGERAYRPSLWVELYDASGTQRAKVQQQRGLLYPGSSLRQRFVFGDLTPGNYKAVVFVDTGADEVVAAQYRLVF